jgi:hypothetical protein
VDELPPELLDLVRGAGTLCLNPEDPGWDNARGYLFDESSMALYFPVSQKYRPLQPEGFRVLIWSQPRVVVTGDLHPARGDDDVAIQLSLAERKGMQPEKARYMLVDQRTNKPRRTRFKLLIRDLAIAQR